MKQPFTTDDYLQAIQRELGKRATTYPKIISKKAKMGVLDDEIEVAIITMNRQASTLKHVRDCVKSRFPIQLSVNTATEYLSELLRELKERKRCYPRWVKLYRMMTQETADYELAVWESLTRWFAKEYLDLEELPTNRKRK